MCSLGDSKVTGTGSRVNTFLFAPKKNKEYGLSFRMDVDSIPPMSDDSIG